MQIHTSVGQEKIAAIAAIEKHKKRKITGGSANALSIVLLAR